MVLPINFPNAIQLHVNRSVTKNGTDFTPTVEEERIPIRQTDEGEYQPSTLS